MENNIVLLSDSYKYTHWNQYPPDTTKVYSYLESRGGKFSGVNFFGLQYILKEYLVGSVVTMEKINKAKSIIDSHLGEGKFNYDDWKYIVDVHGGKLPIRIKAIPEGTWVPVGNVLMTVENTDPKLKWLTNYLETILHQVWYPTTVCTLSKEIKKLIIQEMEITTDYSQSEILEMVQFMLHDFGFRGVSSVESSGLGGAAHLVNFKGTDTMTSISLVQEYYNETSMPAFSVPASEHSTITSWGEKNELDAFENILDKYPSGIVSCVSDSFDIIKACEDLWGTHLKSKIMSRNGRLVIRPDSGDPCQTLSQVFPILWEKFGGIVNKKGYKVLDPHVRVIQGDGINYESIVEIISLMKKMKFSIENIIFGMGGALLQKVDRDTQKFAFKCSSITQSGKEIDVRKNPLEIDEHGNRVRSFKKSKSGRLKLIFEDEYKTIENALDEEGDLMVEVFRDGELITDWNFSDIRSK